MKKDKNNKTFSERLKEKFSRRINPVLSEFEATPEGIEQFFISELKDIIKEIDDCNIYDWKEGSQNLAKQKIIQIIKKRI